MLVDGLPIDSLKRAFSAFSWSKNLIIDGITYTVKGYTKSDLEVSAAFVVTSIW